MAPDARTSPLGGVHEDRGARFTEFGGWEMPVQFDSIRREHAAVREAAGIFDVSHMGQIEVTGPDATALMNRLTTNDVGRLGPGQAQYAAITDEEGIMLDDTVVYRLPPGAATASASATAGGRRGDEGSADEPRYLFVPNAGRDEMAAERWRRHREEWALDAAVGNATADWAMLAVQGPDAPGLVADAAGEAALDCGRFEIAAGEIAGVDCLLARTGYTGEDGFEVLAPWGEAATVWEAFEARPCGLGARDTLRIEAGFLLSGQDFHPEDEPRTPYEAGIGFAVAPETEFVGRDALERRREAGFAEAFTGLRLLERGVPRHGYAVVDPDQGAEIGRVTSGTMSPTLEEPIALGYLPADAAPGDRVGVRIRGEDVPAAVADPPFVGRS